MTTGTREKLHVIIMLCVLTLERLRPYDDDSVDKKGLGTGAFVQGESPINPTSLIQVESYFILAGSGQIYRSASVVCFWTVFACLQGTMP